MSKDNMFRDVISTMMEAVALDKNGKVKVLDEDAYNKADELLNQMIIESAREWWAQLESSEDSLANMSDEISFGEMNTDPSHVTTPGLDIDDDESDAVDIDDESVSDTLENVLGEDDFDLNSIFEMGHKDDFMDAEGDDDMSPVDGDAEYDDLMRGNDEEGLGDDLPPVDDEMGDEDDLDAMGAEDEFGAEEEIDGEIPGEEESDLDLGDDEYSDDEFDFSILDIEDETGDEVPGEEDDEFLPGDDEVLPGEDDEEEPLEGSGYRR